MVSVPEDMCTVYITDSVTGSGKFTHWLTSYFIFLLLPKVTFSDYELIVTIQKGKNLQTNCEHAVFFYFNIMSKDVETFQFYPLILNSKHEA